MKMWFCGGALEQATSPHMAHHPSSLTRDIMSRDNRYTHKQQRLDATALLLPVIFASALMLAGTR